MYYSFFITLSILQPNKSYSKRRCHCSIVLLFFSVLFWYFFTHISERSILNTLNDVRSNLLLDETITLFSFQVLSWWKSYNKNDRDQVLWAHETKHPTQTLVFTETAGRHNLVEVIVILVLLQLVPPISVHKKLQANDVIKFRTAPRGKVKTENGRYQ